MYVLEICACEFKENLHKKNKKYIYKRVKRKIVLKIK